MLRYKKTFSHTLCVFMCVCVCTRAREAAQQSLGVVSQAICGSRFSPYTIRVLGGSNSSFQI